MKKIRFTVEQALEREPNFRERSRRYRGFYVLLMREYPSLTMASKDQLIDFALDFYSMIRTWNKVTEERIDLRGNDYNDKKILEQEAEIELGYEPGYDKNKKTLSRVIAEEIPF